MCCINDGESNLFKMVFAALLPLLLMATPAAANILWDNGPLMNCAACGFEGADESQVQVPLGLSTYGLENSWMRNNGVADDFIVSGDVWDVTRITFFGFAPDILAPLASPFDRVCYEIWDGPPNVATSRIIYGDLITNRYTNSYWNDMYRVYSTASGITSRPIMRIVSEMPSGTLYLHPGTYWIVWQTYAPALNEPQVPFITIDGVKATGNGLWWDVTEWEPALDSTAQAQQDFPFIIEGSKVANFNLKNGVVSIPQIVIGTTQKSYEAQLKKKRGLMEFILYDFAPYP